MIGSKEQSSKVTRADREAAVRALQECGPSVDAWVPAGTKKAGLVFNTDLERVAEAIAEVRAIGPIPMYLTCPKCLARHIDEGEFAEKPHHTHSCQVCGLTWRPALVHTAGVAFLPGFKNEVGEL